jgi:hypothetical protein
MYLFPQLPKIQRVTFNYSILKNNIIAQKLKKIVHQFIIAILSRKFKSNLKNSALAHVAFNIHWAAQILSLPNSIK